MKMHLYCLSALALQVASIFPDSLQASELQEMNTRQTIDNASMNKIVDARLRGLLAGENAQRAISQVGKSERGCNIQIGNNVSDGPLDQGSQDIIIVGTTINYCSGL